ncbi:MAG TPA: class I SAM-dependent methyltransferase [Solirubrobacter sp.]|nr:class I SAM-dependent methyltransferase [Solirubrobacter sp.]
MRSFYEAFWADAPDDPEPWAWERRRALLLAEARPGERVLDLGCGAGRFLAALQDAGADPVGVEIAQAAVDRARNNVPGADVRLLEDDLPLGHGEVDLVWCSETLEHIPDVAHALFEVRRVLKPGGRLLVTVPWNPPLIRPPDPLGQHVRFFTRRSLIHTLDAAGFAPVEVRRARRMLVARATRPGPPGSATPRRRR